MPPREAPVNRWKSGSQGFGRSWHAGAAVPPPRRKTGGDDDAFAYGISGVEAVASPVSHADESDRTDLDASADFSDVDDGGQDASEVPRNLHSAPAMRRAPGASPMRFSFPDESFENSPGAAQRPVQTSVRIRNTETVVAGGIHAEQYTLYVIEVHAPMGDWSVKRRFNDFVSLNKDIAERYTRAALPSLPGRRWFGSLSPETVRHRKWDLEQYLLSLLKLPRVASCELLLAFVEATPDACALRKELADAKQKLQDAITLHEKTVDAQVKVDTENTQLLLKLQKAKDDLAQARRLHQKGEDELAQLAPKINDQASRLEKNTQKLQLLRSDIREKFGEMESLNERMLSLHSQRSEVEQQLADSKALCHIKERELEAKQELIAQAEQQLQQKDEVIVQERQRLEAAKLRRLKVAEKLQALRMSSMVFDDASATPPSATRSSVSPTSPSSFAGGRIPRGASLSAGSSSSSSSSIGAAQEAPRSSTEGGGPSSYRSGVFEVSKGTFSSARVQPLGSSQ